MKNICELENVISFLKNGYDKVVNEWKKGNYYPYNQATSYVKDINDNSEINKDIENYLYFLNNTAFNELDLCSQKVSSTRIKARNSCLDKINFYINEKEEKGHVAINKCINDLFGMRIITETVFNYNEVKNLIDTKFKDFKCTQQNKNGYKAIHIYLKKDNFNYLWELQIWFKGDVTSNKESHEKYKQRYTKFEYQYKEEKGG